MEPKTNYSIGNDELDKPRCRFNFEWYDTNGVYQIVETQDVQEAQIIMSLLSGESCLADYEVDTSRD